MPNLAIDNIARIPEMSDDSGSPPQVDMFEAIERETTLSNRVTRQIETLIVDGRLKPGDRLPSERELAQQLGVSRTVVREAVRALAAKGLLEVRSGSGTTVRKVTRDQVVGPLNLLLQTQGGGSISFEDLHQVRSILEIEIAGLAAVQATEEDLQHLEQIMHDMETAKGTPEIFAAKDAEFHHALAHTTHNPLLVVLLDSIRDLLHDYLLLVIPRLELRQDVLPYHDQILERVAAGDEDGARQAMREHLMQIRRNHEKAFGKTEG